MSTVKSTKVIDRFKPVTRKRDMEKEMYNEIESMAKQCVEMSKDKFKDESVRIHIYIYIHYHSLQEIANYLKKELEKKYADKDYCWHVIVGRNFGGCLTYKEKVMTYFYVGQIGFLIFATSEV